ncbi:hypothetical protein EK21DRAFT_87845 [Setomelanomma holmii]|uniref:Uncharacterized protein n=1 Tax=Setomelanomma holmii TaxID=210430 RepID=A0A9P4LN27_9PLEO|nr:hypothetical protein EK21DRAFT_87845 [Setomelanomma holmii]
MPSRSENAKSQSPLRKTSSLGIKVIEMPAGIIFADHDAERQYHQALADGASVKHEYQCEIEALKKELESVLSSKGDETPDDNTAMDTRNNKIKPDGAEPDASEQQDHPASATGDRNIALQSDVSARNIQIQDVEKSVKSLKTEHERSKNCSSEIIEDLHERVNAVQNDLAWTSKERDELQSKLTVAEVERSKQSGAHLQRITSLEEQLAKSNDALNEEHEKFKTTREESGKHTKATTVAEQEVHDFRKDRSELNQKLKELRDNHDELTQDMRDLKEDKDKLTSEKAILEENVDDLLDKNEKLKDELQAEHKNFIKKTYEVYDLKKKLDAAEKKISELEKHQAAESTWDALPAGEDAVAETSEEDEDASEREFQNGASTTPPSSPPPTGSDLLKQVPFASLAISRSTELEHNSDATNTKQNDGISDTGKVNTALPATFPTVDEPAFTTVDFTVMPNEVSNPFSKFIEAPSADDDDDEDASTTDEEHHNETDDEKYLTSRAPTAVPTKQISQLSSFELDPVKAIKDSSESERPVVAEEIIEDAAPVGNEIPANAAEGTANSEVADSEHETVDQELLPSLEGLAQKSAPPSSSAAPVDKGGKAAFATSAPPKITYVTPFLALQAASKERALQDDELDFEHVEIKSAATQARQVEQAPVRSKFPAREGKSNAPSPVKTLPAPKAASRSLTTLNPLANEFKPSAGFSLWNPRTKEDEMAGWKNAMTKFLAPKVVSVPATKSPKKTSVPVAKAGAEHEVTRSANEMAIEKSVEQSGSSSSKNLETEPSGGEKQNTEPDLSNKGNFADFRVLIAKTKSEKQQVGKDQDGGETAEEVIEDEYDDEESEDDESSEDSLAGDCPDHEKVEKNDAEVVEKNDAEEVEKNDVQRVKKNDAKEKDVSQNGPDDIAIVGTDGSQDETPGEEHLQHHKRMQGPPKDENAEDESPTIDPSILGAPVVEANPSSPPPKDSKAMVDTDSTPKQPGEATNRAGLERVATTARWFRSTTARIRALNDDQPMGNKWSESVERPPASFRWKPQAPWQCSQHREPWTWQTEWRL